MARKRSVVADYGVYLAVRVAVCLLQILSYRAGCAVAGWLAWLAYHLDRRHRLVADGNLRHAFGQLGEQERAELVRGVYRHFCTLLVTMTHLPRKLHPNNWKDYLEMEGGRGLVDGLLSGRPLLLVTGHFGNWELGGYALGLFGFTTHAIARPLDNPFLERFLKRFRERTGQKVLAKKGDFDQMQGLLERGGVMATLGDQDAGPRGLFVDFFGRPASTHKAIAVFALQYRVPMVVLGVAALGGAMRHRLCVEDVIDPAEYEGHPNPLRELTQRFTAALERLARRRPEQYFWLHRRWKHQPAPRKPRRAA